MVDDYGVVAFEGTDEEVAVYRIGYPQRGDLRDRNDAAGDRVKLVDVHRPQRACERAIEDLLIHRQLALDRCFGIDVHLTDQQDVQDDRNDDVETKCNPE